MKRFFLVIASVFVLLSGCGSDTEAPAAAKLSAEDVFRALSEYLPQYETQDAAVTAKLLGLDSDQIKECRTAFDADGGPQALIVLQASDEQAALKAAERMDYYLTTLQSSAAQYAPEQLDLLNKGYIFTRNDYAILIVCDDIDAAKQETAKLFANT